MKTSVIEIVLLGGGYVSVWAYRALAKELRREIASGVVNITVICPEEYHFFHGWTAESLTCIIKDESRMSPLNQIFTKATIISGKAQGIDTTENIVSVILEDGSEQQIHYNHLLLGFGSFDSEAIEGIAEHGHQVKAHQSYLKTKRTIHQLVKQAALLDAAEAERLLTVTVAGCGFTGIELATNIAEFLTILQRDHPSLLSIKPTITLVNSGDKILSTLDPKFERMISYTEKTLKNYGIKLINNNKITRVNEDGAFLSNDLFVRSAMVISTIGQCRIILKGTENMERDRFDRLCTNSKLQINNFENLWGGGDACCVQHAITKQACSTNALWAIKHGESIGRNIALAIKKQPLKAFSFKGLGQTASLGIGKGIGELYGIQFTGVVAWMMRFFVFNYFMPLRSVMFAEINDWMFLLFRRNRRGLMV